MLPTYREGDILVGVRWTKPAVGQVVVVATTERPIVKRVKKIQHGNLWLEGDNSKQSIDSRQQGFYDQNQILARIIVRIFSASE